jgi:hypothetical protein
MKNETIKNGLKVLLVIVIFSSCKEVETEITIHKDSYLKTIVYDSCEYVESNYTMKVFEHKGNCKYCAVRAKNNCH